MELVQWGDCDDYRCGNTFAEYCTPLSEFLPRDYNLPFSLNRTDYGGIEKKVLMKPTLGVEVGLSHVSLDDCTFGLMMRLEQDFVTRIRLLNN